MTIRLFGSNECDKCVAIREALDGMSEPYQFIDALCFDDEANNKLCDDNSVSDLPHVQFLDDQSNVVDEMHGDIAPGHVTYIIETFRNEHGNAQPS